MFYRCCLLPVIDLKVRGCGLGSEISKIVKCSILVSPRWPFQSPDDRSDLSPGSTSSAAARSNSANRKVPLRPLKTLLQAEDVGTGCFGKAVINLLNGSLVFGGPSLLTVVQLLQITLHVEHLLLKDFCSDSFHTSP